MKKILMLIGLPSSGKSTYAKELIKSNPKEYKRVNKDDLRLMIDNSVWSNNNEKFILEIRDFIIEQALLENKTVIVDDTNFGKHEEFLSRMAKDNDAEFEVKFFDVHIDECIRRDSLRGDKSVGKKVIRNMYNKYLKKDLPIIEYNNALSDCIICDIDGTLALMENRSPYEWNKVGTDKVNKFVKEILSRMSNPPSCKIILLSGRDECCRKETEEWLYNNCSTYDYLYMRPKDNIEDDRIIKKRMYDEYIKGNYNVLFVLDDRLKVCRMWYEMGLPLLKVGDPDADF